MIKETEVNVSLYGKNIKYYEALGYKIIRKLDKQNRMSLPQHSKLKVLIKDLLINSNEIITGICDNQSCNKEKTMTYQKYNQYTNNQKDKYYCSSCNNLTKTANVMKKQKEKQLKRGQDGYWNFKENVIKEFRRYIDEYKVIDNICNIDCGLYTAILKYSSNTTDFAQDLGYDIKNISSSYVDNRGDINRSNRELYFANWLIAQGFKDYYLRDIIIDKEEGKYNSDFFLKLNNKELRIEIWGYDDNPLDTLKSQYNEVKRIKKQLYEKLEDKMILISLEPKDFICNFEKMSEVFYEKLKPYLNLKFEKVEWNQIASYNDYSEKEILDELLKYGNGRIPTQKDLLSNEEHRRLLFYIQRKFGGVNYFIKKYNIMTLKKDNYWNAEKIYDTFVHILNKYNKILSNNEIKEYRKTDFLLKGFVDYMRVNGGYFYWQIMFFEKMLSEGILKFNEIMEKQLNEILYSKDRKFAHVKDEHRIMTEKLIVNYFSTTINII